MTQPSFTIGMLVAFQMFASRLSQPMLRLVGLWQEFQQAAIAVKRLGDIMNAPAEPYAADAGARGRGTGPDRDREPHLPLRREPAVPVPRVSNLDDRARPVRRAHGPVGQRQEHARQAAAGLLPADRRRDHDRRPRHPPPVGQRAARSTSASCRRRRCSSPARSTTTWCWPIRTRASTTSCRPASWRRSTRRSSELPAGLPDRDRRARRRALRRPEAAHRDRARAAQAAEDPDLRRGHREPRPRRPPSSSRAP